MDGALFWDGRRQLLSSLKTELLPQAEGKEMGNESGEQPGMVPTLL